MLSKFLGIIFILLGLGACLGWQLDRTGAASLMPLISGILLIVLGIAACFRKRE